jgi:2-oxoglutarate dehydrogenase E1 component
VGNETFEFFPDEPQPGPSWQRGNWPPVGGDAEDDLTQALDPTTLQAEIKKAAKAAGAPIDEARCVR